MGSNFKGQRHRNICRRRHNDRRRRPYLVHMTAWSGIDPLWKQEAQLPQR